MGSPVLTSVGKYSAMLIGMRTQPWLAGWSGTDAAVRWPYLAKPYTRQQLSQTLAPLLRSPGQAT